MSEKKFIGVFFFEKEANGNLSGHCTNNKNKKLIQETPKRYPESPITSDDYVGRYRTTWNQPDGKNPGELIIERKGELFELIWKRADGTLIFKGTGSLQHDVLVGWYEDTGNS